MSAVPNFERPRDRRIILRLGRIHRFLRESDIRFITGAGNYALVHVPDGVHRVRMPLDVIEKVVDPALFVRAHRSTIVNIAHIEHLVAIHHGEYVARMSCGTELRVSRHYNQRFHALLDDAPLRALP